MEKTKTSDHCENKDHQSYDRKPVTIQLSKNQVLGGAKHRKYLEYDYFEQMKVIKTKEKLVIFEKKIILFYIN